MRRAAKKAIDDCLGFANISFASKPSVGRFGFAAGVGFAAVAMPRRKMLFTFLGYALVRRFANKSKGLAPDQGHSHRLTSGGKAESDMAHDF